MDPMLLILPGGLIQGSLVVVATCYSGSREHAVRNDLLGIRLWSTLFSDEAWRAGHKAAIVWSWLIGAVAAVSLGLGIWLIQWDPPASAAVVTTYTLGTLVATLVATGMMIFRAHTAARRVAGQQVLAEEGDLIDAIIDGRQL